MATERKRVNYKYRNKEETSYKRDLGRAWCKRVFGRLRQVLRCQGRWSCLLLFLWLARVVMFYCVIKYKINFSFWGFQVMLTCHLLLPILTSSDSTLPVKMCVFFTLYKFSTFSVSAVILFLMISGPCWKYSGWPPTRGVRLPGDFHTLLLEALWTIKSLFKNPERWCMCVKVSRQWVSGHEGRGRGTLLNK